MKAKEILTYILYGILAIVGICLAIGLIKWLLKIILGGAGTLLALTYAFAPIIIIVLLVIILFRMGKRK